MNVMNGSSEVVEVGGANDVTSIPSEVGEGVVNVASVL
jgi:hypothetical protein